MSDVPHSLSSRLTKTLLLVIGGVWFVVAVASASYARYEINEGMDNGLVDIGHRLLELAMVDIDPATLGAPASVRQPQLAGPTQAQASSGNKPGYDDYLVYQVVDASRQLLLRSDDAPTKPLSVPLVSGFVNLPDWRVYTYKHPDWDVFIHVGDSLVHRREALLEISLRLLLPMLALIPLLALLIRLVLQRDLAPLRTLATQIGQRGGHDLSPVASHAMSSELKLIADSTNHLLHRLGDALDTERALAANAAHELRTPLAATLVRLHALLDMQLDVPARSETTAALASLVQLNRRAEKLLQLSRAESSSAFNSEPVNLGAVAASIAQEFWSDPALLGRLRLHVPTERDVFAMGDFDALCIVLRNLVENAVRHGGNSTIDILVEWPAQLRVRDCGPGLDPVKLSLIRERHVKNTQSGAGFGLGMSIVSSIVERQQAELILTSPPPGLTRGFDALVRLQPAAAPEAVVSRLISPSSRRSSADALRV